MTTVMKKWGAILLGATLLTSLILLYDGRISAQDKASKKRPPTPRLRSKDKIEIKKIIREFFKIQDKQKRAQMLKKLETFDPIPKTAVSGFAKLAFKYAYKGMRLDLKHKTSITTSLGTGQLLIIGVKRGRPQPLLIGLHGGGQGEGDGATSEQKWQSATASGCICVFPTVLKKEATAWNKEREERHVLEIIEAVKRSCRVDTNRIYLVGHSMGGYGAWSIGGHYADLFAGIAPTAGGIFFYVGGARSRLVPGILPNVYNTPVYFFHSTDDKQVSVKSDQLAAKEMAELQKKHPGGYRHVYKEYTNIGHGLPPDGVGPILKYILGYKRDPYPEKIIFEPVRSYKRIFAWVEVPQGSSIRWICAEYDRKENRIAVQTRGGDSGFTLYLQPKKMMNLKNRVTVVVNGKERFSDYVQCSVSALVRTIDEFRDPARYFAAKVRFP